jgi:adenine-specific DNA-methyltransferase
MDITCGSGTTAFVAEKWGRRWITCDTSRVALTLAKQRLMTASFDYYALKYPNEGVRSGFINETVPHIKLETIANNPEIAEIHARLHPAILAALEKLKTAAKQPTLQEWDVPFAFPEAWPDAARAITGRDLSVVSAERREGDPPVLVASSAKARAELGWTPQYPDLAVILQHAWAWHQRRFPSHAGSL